MSILRPMHQHMPYALASPKRQYSRGSPLSPLRGMVISQNSFSAFTIQRRAVMLGGVIMSIAVNGVSKPSVSGYHAQLFRNCRQFQGSQTSFGCRGLSKRESSEAETHRMYRGREARIPHHPLLRYVGFERPCGSCNATSVPGQ
jgi:hypothetical protein